MSHESVSLHRHRPTPRGGSLTASLLGLILIGLTPAGAQERPIHPGEAFVTRFSGIASQPGSGSPALSIDVGGTVGSIIDLRSPGRPPRGEHWIDEPQRRPVTAGEVGQIFGAAFDDAGPPNIYVAATSAFGLHRTPDNRDWMPGLWGPGGPGAIYRLDAATGYRPRLFATVRLNGRENSGPALGNIAFDRWNRQLLVSDLETGMIHRIGLDGTDRGFFDHGTQGRAGFVDGATGQRASLPPIPFDPTLAAAITDCPTPFDRSPECWNFADSGRRVWGLGITRLAPGNEVRLYYGVWSSPAYAQANWNGKPEDDKRNAVWSVRLGPDGSFDPASVRREFILPDFFVRPNDVARAGYSQPVSDIAFPACSIRPVMLVAERGGIRNLGLDKENPFADPHEARLLRYERDQSGAWKPVGRYDVGFYDRAADGPPQIRANCAGGAAFGPGYRESDWRADPQQPDRFVWTTGDSLCSPAAPCNLPGAPAGAAGGAPAPQTAAQGGPQQQGAGAPEEAGSQQDDSEVHGIQGIAEDGFDEVLPSGAIAADPGANADADRPPTPAVGPDQSYLVDTDINVAPGGAPIEVELTRNDATKIGDIAIYDVCPTPPDQWALMPAMPPVVLPAMGAAGAGGAAMSFVEYHRDPVSHAMVASHGRPMSHYRLGSHELELSHGRWRSHTRWFSHGRRGSHNQRYSHDALGSHSRARSHYLRSSRGHSTIETHGHSSARSHYAFSSRGHEAVQSRGHSTARSHYRTASRGHLTNVSQGHSTERSHYVAASRTHNVVRSQGHNVIASRGGGTHALPMSPGQPHNRVISRGGGSGGGHSTIASQGSGTHKPPLSPGQPHNRVISRGGTHDAVRSSGGVGGAHMPAVSRGGGGTHDVAASRGGTHNAILSRGPTHGVAASRGPTHNVVASRGAGGHSRIASRGPTHRALASRGVGRHGVVASRGASRHSTVASRGARHSTMASRGVRTHNPAVSRRTTQGPPRAVRPTPRSVPRQIRDPGQFRPRPVGPGGPARVHGGGSRPGSYGVRSAPRYVPRGGPVRGGGPPYRGGGGGFRPF